ncbi:MAG: arylsulfatase [Phycisphaerales bacterium]|nr:arylsulfatase [Phycisphaerales bacterium]
MKRRQFLCAIGGGVGLALAGRYSGAFSEPAPKPNIVLINADDLGFGDLGCYGATKVKTPNIDKLARQGRMFTDAHSASAVCTPSRYALLTGRYPFRNKGLWAPIFLRDPLIIDTGRMTLGTLMRDAGYATACIGKWHLGFGDKTPVNWNKPLKPGPLELGFDYYFGVPVVNSHPPFVYVENHKVVGLTPDDPMVYKKKAATKAYPEKMGLSLIGGAQAAHKLYNDETVGATLTEKAVNWIKARKTGKKNDKNFFLYLATTNIHHPFTPAPRFKGTSKCGRYGDFIHELDWIVGQVLGAIDEIKATDNTLVIFTSDNGGMLNQGGQAAWKAGHRANSDLLGFKFDAWEGGHRIPFIARWPGRIGPGTTSDQLICNVDMLATFAAILGRKLKPDQGPDSFNVMGALTGKPESPIRDHLVLCPRSQKHITLRKGRWVYITARGNGGFTGRKIGQHGLGGPPAHKLTKHVNSDIEDGKIKPNAPPAQLYDLKADRSQTKNLYNQHPKIVKQMQTLLAKCCNSKRTAP